VIGNGLSNLPHLRGEGICARPGMSEVRWLRRNYGAAEAGIVEAGSAEADADVCTSMCFPSLKTN
jgi:hypothetical protein